jgi:hypothetical protein
MRWFLLGLVIFTSTLFVWWMSCRAYDKDLEADFIRETGMTWKQAEEDNGVNNETHR